MSNEITPPRAGPGRLLGIFSLACFVVALLVATVAAAMVWDIIADPPDVEQGGGGVLIFGGLAVMAATFLAAVSCLVGLVSGIAGLVLALTHPRGKLVLPALGLALNVVPLLGLILVWLFSQLPLAP